MRKRWKSAAKSHPQYPSHHRHHHRPAQNALLSEYFYFLFYYVFYVAFVFLLMCLMCQSRNGNTENWKFLNENDWFLFHSAFRFDAFFFLSLSSSVSAGIFIWNGEPQAAAKRPKWKKNNTFVVRNCFISAFTLIQSFQIPLLQVKYLFGFIR